MKYRHVFLLSSANEHSYTFIESLVNRYEIDSGRIVIYFYNDFDSNGLLFPDVFSSLMVVYKSDPGIFDVIRSSETLTVTSLQPENAKVLVDFHESGCLDYEKVHVRITDDEVARWIKNFSKNQELTVSRRSLIDENVLKVLANVNNFLCLEQPWGRLLRDITQRNINVINAIPLARVIPDPHVYHVFEGVVRESIVRQLANESVVRVLLFSKPRPVIESENILKRLIKELLSMKRQDSKKRIEFLVWRKSRLRNPAYFMLQFLCLLLARVKGFKVDFCEISALPKESYLLMLYRCQYLIFQNRGGLGAATEFLRHGGQVLLESGSLNHKVYDNFLGLNVVPTNNDFKYFDHFMDDRANDVSQYFDENRASAKLAFDMIRSESRRAYKEIYG